MSNVLTALATALTAALSKGPLFGNSGVSTPTALHVLSESASMPVGDLLSSEYVRFGIVPKGARIIRSMSYLSTNHGSTIAGKLQLVPIDGTGTTQEITGVTANLEATEATSIPDVADDVTVAEDSWVQFVPTSTTTIASTAKDIRLRLAYGLPY